MRGSHGERRTHPSADGRGAPRLAVVAGRIAGPRGLGWTGRARRRRPCHAVVDLGRLPTRAWATSRASSSSTTAEWPSPPCAPRGRACPASEASVRRGPAHLGRGGRRGRSAGTGPRRLGTGSRRTRPLPRPGTSGRHHLGGGHGCGRLPCQRRPRAVHPRDAARLRHRASTRRPSSRALSKSTRQRMRAAERTAPACWTTGQGTGSRSSSCSCGARPGAGHPAAARTPTTCGAGERCSLRGWHGSSWPTTTSLLVGGLFLFRQGGIHATAYSADRAASRADLPGTMHLVRWTAIRDALREGVAAIELGGVDLPGHRQPPQPGEPGHGLYEHKRGFGAVWVDRAPPRRIVLRPLADRLARGRRRAIDTLRGMGR